MTMFNKGWTLLPIGALICVLFFFSCRIEHIASAVQKKHKTNSALLVPKCIRETEVDGIPHYEVFAFHYPQTAFLLRADKRSNALINEVTKGGVWTNHGKEKWTTKHPYSMFEVRWQSNQSSLLDSSVISWNWESLPDEPKRIVVEPSDN